MKRIICPFIIAVFCVMLFIGCGGRGKTNRIAVPLDDNTRYTETLSISLGRYVTADPRLPKGDTYTNNAYTRYLKDRLNVVFTDEFEATGEDFDRQISLSIAAGEIPDIMTVQSEDIIKELINAGLIADLTELYSRYASPRLKAIYDSYDGRCLGKVTYDGKLMALPGTRIDDQPFMFWIRQDWVDELGITLDPDGDHSISVNDLERVAGAFIKRDPTGATVGLAFSPQMGDELIAMGAAYGSYANRWIRDETGEIRYGSTTEETRQVLAQLKAWFDAGVLDPQFGTRTWEEISALLINGRLGIVPGQWHLTDWRLPSVKHMDSNAVFKPYSLADANGKIHVSHSDSADRYVVVSKKCANPEAAILLANVLYDELGTVDPEQYPEIGMYIAQGVDNSTKPLWIECDPSTGIIDEYAEYKAIIDGKKSIDEASTVYRLMIARSILNYRDHPASAEVGEWSYYSSRMYGVGLMYDTMRAGLTEWVTPVFWGTTETMKQRGGNLRTLQDEAFVKIITGEPLDAFDTFVSRWTNEGGGTITAEIEKQLALVTPGN